MNVTCGKNYSDRDNGTLSSNTRHCAPLERGDWTHYDSIDIALRWSEKHFTKENLIKACHRFEDECYLLKELFRQG